MRLRDMNPGEALAAAAFPELVEDDARPPGCDLRAALMHRRDSGLRRDNERNGRRYGR